MQAESTPVRQSDEDCRQQAGHNRDGEPQISAELHEGTGSAEGDGGNQNQEEQGPQIELPGPASRVPRCRGGPDRAEERPEAERNCEGFISQNDGGDWHRGLLGRPTPGEDQEENADAEDRHREAEQQVRGGTRFQNPEGRRHADQAEDRSRPHNRLDLHGRGNRGAGDAEEESDAQEGKYAGEERLHGNGVGPQISQMTQILEQPGL